MAKPSALIAVLAGGRGSRLGGEKAGVVLAGRPLVAHVLEAARSSGLPVLLVAKAASVLPALDAELLLEPGRPSHPLCGIVAALRSKTAEQSGGVLAVGCDMPFVSAALMRCLAAFDGAVALRAGGRLQPLPARYPLAGLASLEQSLAAQRPLREAISALDPLILGAAELEPFGDPQQLCFSVNDAADLRTAESWLSRPRGPRRG